MEGNTKVKGGLDWWPGKEPAREDVQISTPHCWIHQSTPMARHFQAYGPELLVHVLSDLERNSEDRAGDI